jgi:hypothetical protein
MPLACRLTAPHAAKRPLVPSLVACVLLKYLEGVPVWLDLTMIAAHSPPEQAMLAVLYALAPAVGGGRPS